MPVLEEFNTTAAATSADWIFVRMQKTFSVAQTGLSAGETLDVHIQSASGTEQLYIKEEAVQLTSTHMMTPVHGPCKFKLVKGVTASGIRVELLQ
jgi:hypothetical protein